MLALKSSNNLVTEQQIWYSRRKQKWMSSSRILLSTLHSIYLNIISCLLLLIFQLERESQADISDHTLLSLYYHFTVNPNNKVGPTVLDLILCCVGFILRVIYQMDIRIICTRISVFSGKISRYLELFNNYAC